MHRFIYVLILFSFSLASCARFQYNTLSSTNIEKEDSSGEFVSENDSIRIAYNFNVKNLLFSIYIQNKLNVPVHADWRRSALIAGEEAVSYTGSKIPLAGTLSVSGQNISRVRHDAGTFSAELHLPVENTFIPPFSHIELKFPLGKAFLLKQTPSAAFTLDEAPGKDGDVMKVKAAVFDEKSSPLKFRSYITLLVGDQPDVRLLRADHEFYVSRIVKTLAGPKYYAGYDKSQGNIYMLSRKTAYGKVMTGIGAAAAITGIAVTEAALAEDNKGCCPDEYRP